MHAIFQVEISRGHRTMKRRQTEFIEQSKLHAGQIRVREKRFRMFANQLQVKAVEDVVRSVSAPQAHQDLRFRVGKCGVQIGKSLLRRTRKEKRPACQRVWCWARHEAQSAQRLESEFH